MSHVRRKRSHQPVRRVQKKDHKKLAYGIFILVLIIISLLLGVSFLNF